MYEAVVFGTPVMDASDNMRVEFLGMTLQATP